MKCVHKLPFLMASSAAIITGIVVYADDTGNQTVYLRMAVMMVAFFLIGLYARSTILSINEEMQAKKHQDELAKKQELRLKREEQKVSSTEMTLDTEKQTQKHQIHKLNLVAEDTKDDFEPLVMGKAISSKLKQ